MQYHSFDELPVLLTVADLAGRTGKIGRNKAYSLSRAGRFASCAYPAKSELKSSPFWTISKPWKRLLDIPHAGAIIGIAVYLPRGIFRRRF